MMARCYSLAQKIPATVNDLSSLKAEIETYLAQETLTTEQVALIGQELWSFNKFLSDLKALEEALK